MISCDVPVLSLFDGRAGKIFFLGYLSLNSVASRYLSFPIVFLLYPQIKEE